MINLSTNLSINLSINLLHKTFSFKIFHYKIKILHKKKKKTQRNKIIIETKLNFKFKQFDLDDKIN